MDQRGRPMKAVAAATSADDVADLIQDVYLANGLLADEVERIRGGRSSVDHATIERLSRMADTLRPGAAARARLSELDAQLVLAGTAIWVCRREAAAVAAGHEPYRWDSTIGEAQP